MIVAVPSIGRAGMVRTQTVLSSCWVYVPELEAEAYRTAGARNVIPVPDEIHGITQAQRDAYSTRAVQVREKERELAQEWERRHGRAPTSRELLYIANDATLRSMAAGECS